MTANDSCKSSARQPKQKSNYLFVDRDEFCRLMLGFTRLVRADDSAHGICGLKDTKTGTVYAIERKKLGPSSPHVMAS